MIFVSLFSVLFGFAIPILSSYNAHLFLTTFLFVFFVVFVCSVALGVFFLFAVFLIAIVTAAGLCTGPIPVHSCGPLPMTAVCMHQLVNSMQHAIKRVERLGESQEAFDGEKSVKYPNCSFLLVIIPKVSLHRIHQILWGITIINA